MVSKINITLNKDFDYPKYYALQFRSQNVSLKTLITHSFLDRYSSNRNNLIEEFYSPCLENSVAYDRAVGYFRSSLLLLTAKSVVDFASDGGLIRLICSPDFSSEDLSALNNGYELRHSIGASLRNEIEKALNDSLGKPMVEFLATLVAVGSLDIKVAFRLGSKGIFHDKVGIFYDGEGNALSFTGSINETYKGWDINSNHESFDVFRSWTTEATRVKLHIEYFYRLWGSEEPGVETIPFPLVAKTLLEEVSNPSGLEAAYHKVVEARMKQKKQPLPHQIKAIQSWHRCGEKGILEHATGSGKTFTAITAIREYLVNGQPVIIMVPSELLLEQWATEIRSELSDIYPKMLLVGAGHINWKKEDVVEGYTNSKGGPRIILATLQSAATPDFISRVQGGKHLVIIVDEVHRSGSRELSKVFSIQSGPRLGLSATPKRYGDPEGTRRILNYFGEIITPPFTLADAISAGRLCPYTYHVHEIYLTDDETQEWKQLTEKIKKQMARSPRDNNGHLVTTEHLKLLLIGLTQLGYPRSSED